MVSNLPAHASTQRDSDNGPPDLGDSVFIFDSGMSTGYIQETFDAIHALQVDNEMGVLRYALYFLPGNYGTDQQPLQVKVGYYTEVAGLGVSPDEVHINGTIEVYNRCYPHNSGVTQCRALTNFWRSLSNLTISVNTLGQGHCEATANMWAVSQAVSIRRVDIRRGNLSLMDYCSKPGYASGGYIADSRIADYKDQTLNNGSQQQWLARNSEFSKWSNAVWNQVFTGVDFTGDPAAVPLDVDYPDKAYTVLDKTPVSREKPYIFVNSAGIFLVRVPSALKNTKGISWAHGITPGRSIPISNFFIARPTDSVQKINQQLEGGKNLLLIPGVYDIADSITVNRADTVVLGIGQATLTAVDAAIPLKIADKPGIIIAGVTIDAGTVESPVLLQVGKKRYPHGDPLDNNPDNMFSEQNPTTLSDIYFRVGGPHIGKVDIALEINSDFVLVDHTWIWRADHGVEGFGGPDDPNGDSERWATNIGRSGVVVNGHNVTATGLFVEHFQEYNTLWNGENGCVVLYQNELPYDPPTQADWMTPEGTLGYAGYKVGDHVTTHHLWGAGVYTFNRNSPDIVTENGYEVPEAAGIKLRHVMTKNLAGPGTINSVVNGFGDTVNGKHDDGDTERSEKPSYVVEYPSVNNS